MSTDLPVTASDLLTNPLKVAIIATGDEIINGSTLDTNTQVIAQTLSGYCYNITTHLTIGDNLTRLTDTFKDLIKYHDIIICTGGLGPTPDDYNRNALSKALDLPLEFSPHIWESIKTLTAQNFPDLKLTDNNKSQAYIFPGATSIPNYNGTAPGIRLTVGALPTTIYLLPGPPHECLPMFEKVVAPQIHSANAAQSDQEIDNPSAATKFSLLLLGAREAELAAAIDKHIPNPEKISYCYAFPYVEVKIHHSKPQLASTQYTGICELIRKYPHIEIVYQNDHFEPHLPTASKQAATYLSQHPEIKVAICDHLTLGRMLASGRQAGLTKQIELLNEPGRDNCLNLGVIHGPTTTIWVTVISNGESKTWERTIATIQPLTSSNRDWIGMAIENAWWMWLKACNKYSNQINSSETI